MMIISRTSLFSSSGRCKFSKRRVVAAKRLQHGLSTFEFVHLPHDRWPLRPSAPVHQRPNVHISVLDSSFNPPTLAHLALANAPRPRPPTSLDASHPSTTPHDYDAKLLLLSIRNADKVLKPSDATYPQRLDMIMHLAQDVVGYNETGQPTADPNVAVAIIDGPRFVDKSRSLLTFLRRRMADLYAIPSSEPSTSSPNLSTTVPTPLLTFLQGLDTLGRLFSPLYYENEEKMIQELRCFFAEDRDGCRVVCARRVQRPSDSRSDDLEQRDREIPADAENHILSVVPLQEYIDSGRISLINIGEDVQILSSSELRDKAQRCDEGWRRMTTSRVVDYIVQHNLYRELGTSFIVK